MPNPSLDERPRAARDIIAAVVDNMRRNLEPLKYSTLAPSRYLVFLHPAEYVRLEGIIPILQEETYRALGEALEQLNRRSIVRRYASRLIGDGTPRVKNAGGEWHVEFLADPDGEVAEGAILVDSELLLPASPELGAGERTRRITTVRSAQHTTARVRTGRTIPEAAAPRLSAQLVYEDQSGHHTYDILTDSVTIGRGGLTHPVDLKIVSSADVSREHARIRRDEATGRFFLTDLSSLGTTLNGRHVPRGYDEVNGARLENQVETALPDRARIGLADTVYLDFSLAAP